MATHSPDYSDDEFDFDEEYFSRTYQPLSNLPTPPPSSRESLASQSPRALLEDGGLLDSALLGPAIHLVNLVPPAVSLTAPSVTLVHEILVRSDLPLDAIALAVCILDSLSSKFSLNWRLLCPLAQRELNQEVSKRHTIQARPTGAPQLQLHIDSVNPEVIILAALVIAFKFLEDCHEPTHYYRSAWGKDLWTSEQINVTERCIMENLGYRILPLWDPVLIADAIADMQRAARHATGTLSSSSSQPRNGEAHKRSASSAVLLSGSGTGLGPVLPLTPAETPVEEDGPAIVGGGRGPAREAAGAAALGSCDGSAAAVDASRLCLPRRAEREVCPAAG